jgi:DNA-binding response OmpR family regulator
VVIVDMGLPDGCGVELIEELTTATPRVSALLGLSGDEGTEDLAIKAGADGFLAKPLISLAEFQQAVLAVLPSNQRPSGVREIPDDVIIPDPTAYRDDMSHVADLLDGDTDGAVLDYVAQFLGGVARSAEDTALVAAAGQLKQQRKEGMPTRDDVRSLIGMVRDRITQKVAI